MMINQLPITSNAKTTGHKLQGSSVDHLFVHAWYQKGNWPYVVLSRVRTISGLFLREPLLFDVRKYAMSTCLRKKIDKFRTNSRRPVPSRAHYKWMESNRDSNIGEPFDYNL